MKTAKFALCGVLAVAAMIAALDAVGARQVETWWIYDVKPWIHYGKPVDPPIGEGLKVQPKRPNIDA